MLKWVVTRGPSGTVSRVPSSYPQTKCSCNKENHAEDTTEMENNNSDTCHNFENNCCLNKFQLTFESKNQCSSSDNRRPSFAARENSITPLSSRNPIPGRAKNLRTRRERNKTLIKRLSAATSLTNLSEIVTPASSPQHPQPLDPSHPGEAEDAQLLQHILNSNRLFNEREVKTPEDPSPLESGHLCRQRAVRRKHGKATQPVDPNDSASFFNCFVFRELAQEMLI